MARLWNTQRASQPSKAQLWRKSPETMPSESWSDGFKQTAVYTLWRHLPSCSVPWKGRKPDEKTSFCADKNNSISIIIIIIIIIIMTIILLKDNNLSLARAQCTDRVVDRAANPVQCSAMPHNCITCTALFLNCDNVNCTVPMHLHCTVTLTAL